MKHLNKSLMAFGFLPFFINPFNFLERINLDWLWHRADKPAIEESATASQAVVETHISTWVNGEEVYATSTVATSTGSVGVRTEVVNINGETYATTTIINDEDVLDVINDVRREIDTRRDEFESKIQEIHEQQKEIIQKVWQNFY